MSSQRTNRKSINRRIEKYVKVTISNTAALSLNGTPAVIIPALAGFTHVIDTIYATKAAGTAYTIGSNAGFDFKYTNSSGTVAANLVSTGFIDQTTIQNAIATPVNVVSVGGAQIVMQSKTADVTGTGAPSIVLRVYYRDLPIAL